MTQLFNRFMQGQIYTYIGDILLAVNPFTQLGIYNDEVKIEKKSFFVLFFVLFNFLFK